MSKYSHHFSFVCTLKLGVTLLSSLILACSLTIDVGSDPRGESGPDVLDRETSSSPRDAVVDHYDCGLASLSSAHCLDEGVDQDTGGTQVDDCNGRDDDQDGRVDEDFIPQAISCEAECAQMITSQCVEGAVINDCAILLDNEIELCDGLDNDCDGLTDEGLSVWSMSSEACGEGVCAGTLNWRCIGGEREEICAPQIEETQDPLALRWPDLCDGVDNDCDGRFDEDSAPHIEACVNLLLARSYLRVDCISGNRSAGECGSAESLCDDDPPPESQEDCICQDLDVPDIQGSDSNCDGLDGVIANAWFIEPTLGNDLNTGEAIAPLKTLSEALSRHERFASLWPEEAPRDLYLAAGEYTIPSTRLSSTLRISGGYQAQAINGTLVWTRPSRSLSDLNTVIQGEQGKAIFEVFDDQVEFYLDGVILKSGDGLRGDEQTSSSIGLTAMNCSQVTLSQVKIISGTGARGSQGIPVLGNFPPAERLAGGEATSMGGGAGGQNLECCPSGECAGGDGADEGQSGRIGSPQDQIQRMFGLGGILFEYYGTVSAPQEGEPGQSGSVAHPSANPLGGLNVNEGTWTPLFNGISASEGSPGGGGGGGASYLISEINELNPTILSGGGGGAGGCGGSAGQSGGAGGWSIGIIVGLQCRLSMEDVHITRGQGGDGGDGGVGGRGETGGVGGASELAREIHSGASGGRGGCGGHGAGGHGGSSVGLIYLDYISLDFYQAVITSGAAGSGGAGPTLDECPDLIGVSGENGILSEAICCFTRSLSDPIARCGLCF